MNVAFAFCVSIVVFLHIPAHLPAQDAQAIRPAAAEKPDRLAALERKLLGSWRGPACGGDFTFRPDGTFDVRNFTPGQNNLAGTWSMRWDALPPTLLLTFKTSDIRKRDRDRVEFEYLGKTGEGKVRELNDKALVFQFPGDEWVWQFTRWEGEVGSVDGIE